MRKLRAAIPFPPDCWVCLCSNHPAHDRRVPATARDPGSTGVGARVRLCGRNPAINNRIRRRPSPVSTLTVHQHTAVRRRIRHPAGRRVRCRPCSGTAAAWRWLWTASTNGGIYVSSSSSSTVSTSIASRLFELYSAPPNPTAAAAGVRLPRSNHAVRWVRSTAAGRPSATAAVCCRRS